MLEQYIQGIFDPLRKQRSDTFPKAGAMSSELRRIAPSKRGSLYVNTTPEILKLFATASVEMWLRGVHSFLISSALTNVSDIWASVSGYYSSHYTMRALAHLLGYYHLRKNRMTINLEPSVNGFTCKYSDSKGEESREHIFYWKKVKEHHRFISNELFTLNYDDGDVSDAGHRNFANYIDHINNFKIFSPLSLVVLKKRIEHLSKIQLTAYPIPDRSKYCDIESVQIVAYHRLVFYRNLVDEALGNSNRFWSVYRNPNWCSDIIKFQLVSPAFLENYR